MTSLGIVAVVPFWSNSDNLNQDSNYSYLRTVLPRMIELTERTLFIVFFPDPTVGRGKWRYVDDGLQGDRIRFVSWPYDTNMRQGVMGFDPHRFDQIDTWIGPSVYWLHQIEMGPFIYGGYQQSFSVMDRPIIVGQHHYIIHKSIPFPYESMRNRQWLQIGGTLLANRIVFNSDHCLKMANESFREFLHEDAMRRIWEKSRTLRFGLIREDDPLAPEAETGSVPLVLYNHRFEGYKCPEKTFEALHLLRNEGFKFQVAATQVLGQRAGKFGMVDLNLSAVRRDDYMRNIARPAINTINSAHETFCISMMDSISCGHLVVVPNRITFPELVPEGYPYLFENVGQQVEMLKHVLGTWPAEYNKWREVLQRHARGKFALDRYVDAYLELLSEDRGWSDLSLIKEHNAKPIERIVSEMKGTYLLVDAMKEMRRKTGLGTQALSARKVARILWLKGFDFTWQKRGVAVTSP